MKFVIDRSSVWGPDKRPYKGAALSAVPAWDRRTFESEAEYDKAGFRDKWRDRGSDFGFWRNADGSLGGIQRRLPDQERWTIEVDNLDGIMALARSEGCPVIVTPGSDGELPRLELYDDYRE